MQTATAVPAMRGQTTERAAQRDFGRLGLLEGELHVRFLAFGSIIIGREGRNVVKESRVSRAHQGEGGRHTQGSINCEESRGSERLGDEVEQREPLPQLGSQHTQSVASLRMQ